MCLYFEDIEPYQIITYHTWSPIDESTTCWLYLPNKSKVTMVIAAAVALALVPRCDKKNLQN